MTHRQLLVWLTPLLEKGSAKGLDANGVRAIREELERMQRKAGPLQPLASSLLNLVRAHATLDAKTVATFAREVRSELAPPREQTVLLVPMPERDKKQG